MAEATRTADAPSGADATVGQLVAQLSEQTSRLVRDEMRLAQAEIKAAGKHAGVGIGAFSAAGLLVFYALGGLWVAIGLALALVLPGWAAALIVVAILLVAAGVAALVGKKKVQQASPTPERTIETVHETIDDVKAASKR